MNREIALGYASAGVAASVAAIVMVGSAFGFAVPTTPADSEAESVDPTGGRVVTSVMEEAHMRFAIGEDPQGAVFGLMTTKHRA